MKLSVDAYEQRVRETVISGAGLDKFLLFYGEMRSYLETISGAIEDLESRIPGLAEKDPEAHDFYTKQIETMTGKLEYLIGYASQGKNGDKAGYNECADVVVLISKCRTMDYYLTKTYKL